MAKSSNIWRKDQRRNCSKMLSSNEFFQSEFSTSSQDIKINHTRFAIFVQPRNWIRHISNTESYCNRLDMLIPMTRNTRFLRGGWLHRGSGNSDNMANLIAIRDTDKLNCFPRKMFNGEHKICLRTIYAINNNNLLELTTHSLANALNLKGYYCW